jgi:hypothetical protein
MEKITPKLPSRPLPQPSEPSKVGGGLDLEEALVMIGFLLFNAGMVALWGWAVAVAVSGFILFGLGIGLAIYKGAR